MHDGKSFGKFVAEDLLPGQTRRVYLAHQRNSQERGTYVVKVFSVAESGAGDVSGTARRWLDGISFQDRVAQDWHDVVAPVVERPTKAAEVVEALNSGTVWYVTRRYAGSLNDLLAGLGGSAATAKATWLVCRAVTRGALAFKQVDTPTGGRRSHGNLKAGNILFSQLPVVEGETEIVVTDPAPVLEEGDAGNPARIEKEFEQSDLVEIGKLLFQMVAGRVMSADQDWSAVWNLPEGDAVRWREVFGRTAGNWQTLCKELLEARTSVKPPTLAGIDQRLGTMEPRVEKPILPKILAVAALLVLTGLGSWLFTNWQLRGVIVVQVKDPAGLEADVTVRNRSNSQDVKTGHLVKGEATFQVKSGYDYDIVVKPKGAFSRLPSGVGRQFVEPRSRTTKEIPIEYVLLKVSVHDKTGAPVPAELSLDGNTNRLETLPTTLYLVPTNRPHQLDLAPRPGNKVLSTNLVVLLDRSGQTLDTNVFLNPERPGYASVIFRAGAMLPLTFHVGSESFELGRDRFQMPLQFQRGQSVEVSVQPPFPWREQSTTWTVPETNQITFPLDFMKLDTTVMLDWSNLTPADSQLLVATAAGAAVHPLGSLAERRLTLFPSESSTYTFIVRRRGYKSWTNSAVGISPGITNLVKIPDLVPEFGFLQLSANLPGFQVYGNDVLMATAAGTQAMVYLPPYNQHDLTVVYSNDFGLLPARHVKARVQVGETNYLSTAFDYVRIDIAPTPTNAAVYRVTSDGQTAPLIGNRYFQAAGVTNHFRVQMDHYETKDVALGFPTAGIPLQPTPIVLIPRKYPVYFDVSPPDAILYEAQSGTGFSPGTNLLDFGTYSVVATSLMLGSVTNSFTINPDTIVTQRWVLPSGSVSIVTGEEGLGLKIYPDDPALAKIYDEQNGNEWLRAGQPVPWKTPVLNAPLPPGGYQVVFSDGRERATNHIQITLNQLTNVSLPQIAFPPPAYTNSLGMTFLRVPGESTYIAGSPVSRRDFDKVLDPSVKLPAGSGDKPAVSEKGDGGDSGLPAASLKNMNEFCRLLTEREVAMFRLLFHDEHWEYELPRVEDWRNGARLPKFTPGRIQNSKDGKESDLVELVLNGSDYVEAAKDPAQQLSPVGEDSLKNGRADLGFRVVLRRKSAAQ